MPLDKDTADYLRERVRRADAILFTGAGFSKAVKNLAGQPMPLAHELKPTIWDLCYPGVPVDPASKLDDLFQVARAKNPRGLTELLRRHLSVDPDSVPPYYAAFLSLPWYRVYTLNVDDLATAIGRRHPLRRKLVPISAVRWTERPRADSPDRILETIHLNGMLDDAPDGVTFSPTQYAERLAGQEPVYAQCAVDVLSRPVIYVGSPLDESPLWQHVQMRRRGVRSRREFRKRSFIVTPRLDLARRDFLHNEFNVTHLALSFKDFAEAMLGEVGPVIEEGFALLKTSAAVSGELTEVPLAQDLSTAAPPGSAEFLLGKAPDWGDVRDGFAAPRDCDAALMGLVEQGLAKTGARRGAVLVSGTAGSGKSAAVLRLAMTVSARGTKVAWVDNTVDISPTNIRRSMERPGHAPVLVIEDADRYGHDLPGLVGDISSGPDFPLVVVSIRTGRGADRFSDRMGQLGVPFTEHYMPNLTDPDIRAILGVLEQHNRLGVLRNKGPEQQFRAFKQVAGSQLIVALLEATSGRRFRDLIISEMRELDADTRTLYAITAVASALRFGLMRDELLLAVGDVTNVTLGGIDALQRKHLLAADRTGVLHVRHRVIADVLLRALAADGVLPDVITGLAIAAASKIGPGVRRGHKNYRRMRSLMKHDWLSEQIGVNGARSLYEELEPFMNWDYHYWLQRGSFELERGDNIEHAENFLNQAYALEPDDILVHTAYGYLKLRLAVSTPLAPESRGLRDDGFELLREAIASHNGEDPHPFHIYGSLGLEWLRRGDVTPEERADLLKELAAQVEAGRRNHPRDDPLRELNAELQKAQLGIGSI